MPTYAHVPLALNVEGKRLAKRDGAVTLAELTAAGVSTDHIIRMIAASIPLPPLTGAGEAGPHLPETAAEMLSVFSPDRIKQAPWTVVDPLLESTCGL